MTAQVTVDQVARQAFKAVQDKARANYGGNTQQLLVVYAVESFLRRLSISDHAHQMVLKGGMLMAASQIRQMTKDADLWVTSRLHRMDAQELREHILAVASNRGQPVVTMAEALANMPDRQQAYEAMLERMSYLSPPPERWSELIDGVIEFVDPLLADDGRLSHWDPEALTWR